MLKNILVPLDGTPMSEAALAYAKVLAAKTGGSLTLMRAVHAVSSADAGSKQGRAIAEAEEYLAEFASELTERGFTVTTGVPYGSAPAAWIVDEVGLRAADLIVMATHDRAGTDRLLHGSVAEEVVHRSPVPVMLIRAAEGLRPAEGFHREQPAIVVPLDGSPLAESALSAAVALASAIGGRFVLVGVVPAASELIAGEGGAIVAYTGEEHARLEGDAEAYLRSSGERVAADGMSVTSLVRSGKPAAEIADIAYTQSAAAIVMATHGRTGLVRTMRGSVAGEVVHRSTCPVVLVSPAWERRPVACAPS